MNEVLDGLIMDNDEWNSIKQAVGSLKTSEAKDKFAAKMKQSAGLSFPDTTVIEGKTVKDYKDAIKQEILGNTEESDGLKKFASDVLDSLVTDSGEFTRGSVLMLSSVATVMNNIKKRSEQLESGKTFDLENMSDELIKESTTDLMDFIAVTMAVIGPNSEITNNLADILGDKVKN